MENGEPQVVAVEARTRERIARIVANREGLIRLSLQACAHCAFCAESCFMYRQSGDPTCTPSYKAINSIGKIWRKKGRLSEAEFARIGELAWDKCVLCSRQAACSRYRVSIPGPRHPGT